MNVGASSDVRSASSTETNAQPGTNVPATPLAVGPATNTAPEPPTASSATQSGPAPPRNVAARSEVRPGLILATKPSKSPLWLGSRASALTGKSLEGVRPATRTLPDASNPTSVTTSLTTKRMTPLLPPRNVEATNDVRPLSSFATKASPPPLPSPTGPSKTVS